jgi:hypothetical protein
VFLINQNKKKLRHINNNKKKLAMKNYEGNRVCKRDKSKDQCNDHKEG